MKVFIALGSQQFQLNRLLQEMDALIDDGAMPELDVFAQIGFSTYLPKNYPYTHFCSGEELDGYISQADLLIIHSGAATIMKGLNAQKPIIVYPRKAAFHEHVDDHQMQLARELEQRGHVLVCGGGCLAEAVKMAIVNDFQPYIPVKSRIPAILRDYIEQTKD